MVLNKIEVLKLAPEISELPGDLCNSFKLFYSARFNIQPNSRPPDEMSSHPHASDPAKDQILI